MKKFCLPGAACLMILFLFACSSSRETTAKNSIVIKNLVDSQRYVFNAQSVQPIGARNRQLTSGFHCTVTPDTISCYLPYFGRAYSANIDPSGGAINFTSTDFDYKIKDNNTGRWDVAIHPRDAPGYQEVTLVIFNNGSATVKVVSNNRQTISFNGFIDRKIF